MYNADWFSIFGLLGSAGSALFWSTNGVMVSLNITSSYSIAFLERIERSLASVLIRDCLLSSELLQSE